MNVFISWSGEKSKALAELLKRWLSSFMDGVNPWLSSQDIRLGSRWSKEIGEKLSSVDVGIICLTQESLSAPWVLFEAGALSKSMDAAYVIPLLVDVKESDLTGSPLGQFQATRVDETGMRKLALDLANVSKDEKALKKIRDSWELIWPGFETGMKKVSAILVESVAASTEYSEIPENELFSSDGILWQERKLAGGDHKTYSPVCPECHIKMKRMADFVKCKKCGFENTAPSYPSIKTYETPISFGRGW